MSGPLHPVDPPYVDEPMIPADDDMVTLRYGDLAALDSRCTMLTESLQCAKEDLAALAALLEIEAVDVTAHELVTEHIIPRIRVLMVTQSLVNTAAEDVRQLVVAGDGPEIDLGNGRAMKLVGRRLPAEIARDVLRPGRGRDEVGRGTGWPQ